jgi:hypothetical protein
LLNPRKEGNVRKSYLVVLCLAAMALAGCDYQTQTSSGKDWLAAYPATASGKSGGGDIDARVRAAAAVEPTLRFPARIGIARIGRVDFGPGLVPLPAAEAAAWAGVKERLGPGFGELIPISPMIAAMVEPESTPGPYGGHIERARHVLDTIRLAAARQHLDAVLVYEVDATADARSNPLSIGEWTLIGAFILPSQDVKAVGVAQAMLIDVRNGYPYGQVTSTANDTTESVRFQTRETQDALSEKVSAAAVEKLAGETETLMRKLQPELAALDTPKHRR